jgi:G3E family GTPase
VAQELWVDDELLEENENSAVLDAVVTLVDASNVLRQLKGTYCISQIPTPFAHKTDTFLQKKRNKRSASANRVCRYLGA